MSFWMPSRHEVLFGRSVLVFREMVPSIQLVGDAVHVYSLQITKPLKAGCSNDCRKLGCLVVDLMELFVI